MTLSNKLTAGLLLAGLGIPLAVRAQSSPVSAARAEFIEVAKNVRLHVTDLGEGTPVVLIHGWPLSDAMYESLNKTNRPQLLEDFGKIFAASETSLSLGIAAWLGTINWQASSFAMGQCLVALRDTDLRSDLRKINLPTLILHGKKDKICSYDLAEQTKNLVRNSVLVPFENSGHALFVEERQKFNQELVKFISTGSTVSSN